MNEPSSFCDGSWQVLRLILPRILIFSNYSGTGANLSNTSLPFILPGEPGNLIHGLSHYQEHGALALSPFEKIIQSGKVLATSLENDLTCTTAIIPRSQDRAEILL